jgi:hypothetical protein
MDMENELDTVARQINLARKERRVAPLLRAALILGECRARAYYDNQGEAVAEAERRLWYALDEIGLGEKRGQVVDDPTKAKRRPLCGCAAGVRLDYPSNGPAIATCLKCGATGNPAATDRTDTEDTVPSIRRPTP